MSKLEIKKNFINKLELFYRNFGSEWRIDEIISNENQQDYIIKFLPELEEKGIIKLNSDKTSFTIIDLPSNHPDLFSSND